jgi:hypothetical protein
MKTTYSKCGATVFNSDSYTTDEDIVLSNVVFWDGKILSIGPPKIGLFSMYSQDARAELNHMDVNYYIVKPLVGDQIQIFYKDGDGYVIDEDGEISPLNTSIDRIRHAAPQVMSPGEAYSFSYIDDGKKLTLTHVYDVAKEIFHSFEFVSSIARRFLIPHTIGNEIHKLTSYGSLISALDRVQGGVYVIINSRINGSFVNHFYVPSKKSNTKIEKKELIAAFYGDAKSNPDTKKIAQKLYPYIEHKIQSDAQNKNTIIGSTLDRGGDSKKIAKALIPKSMKRGKRIPEWMVEHIEKIRKRIAAN